MRTLIGFLVVTIVSWPQVYAAVPLGYWFGLDTSTIMIAALVGSVSGTVIVVYVGSALLDRVKRWWRAGGDPNAAQGEPAASKAPSSKAREMFNSYGAVWFCVLAPVLIGGFATALTAVAMGTPKAKVAVWAGIGQGTVTLLYVLLLRWSVV